MRFEGAGLYCIFTSDSITEAEGQDRGEEEQSKATKLNWSQPQSEVLRKRAMEIALGMKLKGVKK